MGRECYERGIRDQGLILREEMAAQQTKARAALYEIPDDPARTAPPGELPGDAPIPDDDDLVDGTDECPDQLRGIVERWPRDPRAPDPDDHHPDSREHQE
jgi:hypothetical protein